MSSSFWRQARFGKGYSPNKIEPDDSELVWPEHVEEDEEEDELDPSIDVVDLMNGGPDKKPHRVHGGYRAQTWKDEWIEGSDG
jgi:hypothetical protein